MPYSAWAAVGAAAILSTLAVGCDAKADDATVTCPAPTTSVFEAADVSSSDTAPKHRQAIDTAFDRALTMAARCPDVEAHLVVFASGPGDSRVVYDGRPQGSGPNDRARAHNLKVAVLPRVRSQVQQAVAEAASALGPGSDPLAGFDLLGDYARTHPDRKLVATVRSDGVSTSTRLALDHPLTADDRALATTVAAPVVAVVSLTMPGVGATAPPPPPADYVADLRTFWTTVCQRVAPQCVVTSEVTK
ncbi:MAG: hypothetical protein QOG43_363 [Actinomycetota bacterium]|nr:hypothetical protein [Actinomycetota bacterium]